jgi:hypothetical protein
MTPEETRQIWIKGLNDAVREDDAPRLLALLQQSKEPPATALIEHLVIQAVQRGKQESCNLLLRRYALSIKGGDRLVELAYAAQHWEIAVLLVDLGYTDQFWQQLDKLVAHAPLTAFRKFSARTVADKDFAKTPGIRFGGGLSMPEEIFHAAIRHDRADIAEWLVHETKYDSYAARGFLIAACEKKPAWLPMLRKNNIWLHDTRPLLLEAVRHGRVESAQTLIQMGAPVSPAGPLLCAAMVNGNAKMLKALLDAGADVWDNKAAAVQLAATDIGALNGFRTLIEEALQKKKKENAAVFRAYFGETYTLHKLRTGENHGITGVPPVRITNSFTIAAKAGLVDEVLELARKGPPRLEVQDFLFEDTQGTTALEVMVAQDEWKKLCDYRLWHRPEEDFAILKKSLPSHLQEKFLSAATSSLERRRADENLARLKASGQGGFSLKKRKP